MLRSSLSILAAGAAAVLASEEPIAGYQPGSDVTEHLRIDLDVEELIEHVSNRNFASAREIYRKGGHSGARAVIALSRFPDEEIQVGTGSIVRQGDDRLGYVKRVNAGSSIEVAYTSIKGKECQEGGKSDTDVTGCFTEDVGDITIQQIVDREPVTIVIPRSTIASVDNKYRTIQSFSTNAEKKMSGQPVFQKYKTYFGRSDYGDKIIDAALDLDSGAYIAKPIDMRKEVSKKAAVYMNIWLWVIREMEDAINDCQSECQTANCNEDPVRSWDEAVAYYVGSKAVNGDKETSKASSGVLLYALADKRCRNFGTCNANQIADVNVKIIEEFKKGQEMLRKSQCFDVVAVKERVVNLMTIPLLQGALRYAYIVSSSNKNSRGSATPKAVAEGFIFAESILPRVAACSSRDAKIILDNQVGTSGAPFESVDAMKDGFEAVKAAYERNYACLGITCKDVGGLELAGLPPCSDASTANDDGEEDPEAPTATADLAVECIRLLSTLA